MVGNKRRIQCRSEGTCTFPRDQYFGWIFKIIKHPGQALQTVTSSVVLDFNFFAFENISPDGITDMHIAGTIRNKNNVPISKGILRILAITNSSHCYRVKPLEFWEIE